jgi:catechol 2,3-dioxygenase-like lactoylglutathione lyase family enzyme
MAVNVRRPSMSRVQLALNVSDLAPAVDFYSKLFGVEPAKVRPGYANFAISDPPLKLVLIEGGGAGGTINHLGVELDGTDHVVEAQRGMTAAGLQTKTEDGIDCCYALQDKVWVEDPDGAPWELYAVLGDGEVAPSDGRAADGADAGTPVAFVTPDR